MTSALNEIIAIRIADLDTIEKIFRADLYYHGKCLNKDLKEYETAKTPQTNKGKEPGGKRQNFKKIC